jgi:hypothetical protein
MALINNGVLLSISFVKFSSWVLIPESVLANPFESEKTKISSGMVFLPAIPYRCEVPQPEEIFPCCSPVIFR